MDNTRHTCQGISKESKLTPARTVNTGTLSLNKVDKRFSVQARSPLGWAGVQALSPLGVGGHNCRRSAQDSGPAQSPHASLTCLTVQKESLHSCPAGGTVSQAKVPPTPGLVLVS